ncbi:MAG: precorrin-6A synthase (deacetylating), partial [Albidovulum sp.]
RIVGFDLPVRDVANPDYRGGVADWHDAIATVWKDTVLAELGPSGRVGLLVWGDPSLYDSTLRIAGIVAKSLPLSVRVVPGITALQALTAAHAIPLNEVGEPFIVTTGRQLRAHGWPAGANTVAVMLDGECAFETIPPDGVMIWWGAYLGMANQIILAGPLSDLAKRIIEARAEARARHGWIMDIYILRRACAFA